MAAMIPAKKAPTFLYHYRARVPDAKSVYDGDTITVDIDLGFRSWMRGQKLRLFGLDTPEVRGPERPEGLDVRDYVREILAGREVMLESVKDSTGKYGRWLAIIWVPSIWLGIDDAKHINFNHHLIETGRAVSKDY